MLRRKHHRPDNLKQEKERKTARYLKSFLSQVRDPRRGISEQKDSRKGDEVAKENAEAIASTSEGRENPRIEKSKKPRVADNKNVDIGLSTFDRSEISKIQPRDKAFEPGEGSAKTTRDESTQMRESSSIERLHGNEDIDDDSSLADEDGRPKYVLVGWDDFRSKLMVLLLLLLFIWAVIYFPLVGT